MRSQCSSGDEESLVISIETLRSQRTLAQSDIELEIPLLLPGVEKDKDECLNRLEASLQNYKGIIRAHGQSYLVCRKQVRRWI